MTGDVKMIVTLIQQTAPAAGGGGEFIASLLPILLIGLIFYFLMIRPQNQRLKKHRAMLDAVVRGDTVVTNGGLIGKVKKVNDDELTVTLAANNDVKVVRSMIAEVRTRSSAAND